jgi:hypothetical protein
MVIKEAVIILSTVIDARFLVAIGTGLLFCVASARRAIRIDPQSKRSIPIKKIPPGRAGFFTNLGPFKVVPEGRTL